MFRAILVPTDGSSLSDKAVAGAIEFAKINPGSQIIGLSVVEHFPYNTPDGISSPEVMAIERGLIDLAKQNVAKLAEAASVAGIPCEVITARSSSPSEEIIKAASKYKCDCIVMASHGRSGLSQIFMGSVTQKVLTQTSIPVMVYR